MARPLTPNAILKSRGSKHVRDEEPEFQDGIGEPPIRLIGVGLETWHDFVDVMKSIGATLTKMDRLNLIELCDARQNCEDAQIDIDKTGLKSTSERGIVKNQSISTKATFQRVILSITSAYGLTLSSRGKIHGPKSEPLNDFDNI
jgi:P27 family predicted phage terminase small subunit